MDEAKRNEVATYLKEIKAIISIRGLDVAPRRKNLDALIDLRLTQRNRLDEVMSLTPDNYQSGPEPDRDMPGDVWIFHKTINEREVYIKLKIADTHPIRIARCISFHAAEFDF